MKALTLRSILLAIISILSLSIVFSFGCAKQKTLTTDEAKSIIIKQSKYPQIALAGIRIGPSVQIPFLATDMKAYLEEGLITSQEAGSAGGRYNVSFTEEGKKYTVSEVDMGGFVDIKLADKQFVEVTKITPSKDYKEATIEHTWKYDNITPFGKYWKRELKNEQINGDELHTGKVIIGCNNNEWTVTRVLEGYE